MTHPMKNIADFATKKAYVVTGYTDEFGVYHSTVMATDAVAAGAKAVAIYFDKYGKKPYIHKVVPKEGTK